MPAVHALSPLARRILAEIRCDDDLQSSIPSINIESARQATDVTIEIMTDILYHINSFEGADVSGGFYQACQRALKRVEAPPDPHPDSEDRTSRLAGALGLLALTSGLVQRRLSQPGRDEQARLDQQLKDLFGHRSMQRALHRVYDPARDSPEFLTDLNQEAEAKAWSELDPATFEYFKAGTTSFIVTCARRPQDSPQYEDRLALKCVLYPWCLIPSVAKNTVGYAGLYRGAPGPVVVRAAHSTARWVLMPFVSGSTLDEYLTNFENTMPERVPQDGLRIAAARKISDAITRALRDLADGTPLNGQQISKQHLDLSPSNIIILEDDPSRMRVCFVDLGVNHLYTRQVGIADSNDSVYVAPEVKNRMQSATSDLYSLAVILIRTLTGFAPRDGRVPDEVYEISPALGEVLDDLLEEQPVNRLLYIETDETLNFDRVVDHLKSTFDLVISEPGSTESWRTYWYAKLSPSSHETGALFQQFRTLRDLNHARRTERHKTYLLFFSALAAAAFWYIFAKSALFQVDDLVTGHFEGLPQGVFLAAAIIAFSQGLTAAKFYQTVLARLTVRGSDHWLAGPTEVSMRLMAFVALPTAILAVDGHPTWWPWLCAAGAYTVAVANLLTLRLAREFSALGAAGDDGFSTVPPRKRKQASGGYGQWWWTMLIYAVVITVIAVGLQTGALQDQPAYVFGLVLISVAIHYVSKFVIAGHQVRGDLARAFATGRRLSVRKKLSALPDWPGFRREHVQLVAAPAAA